MSKEREAFERAIQEKPDDVAGYAAYADWLQEHDDPRGEFIATQLALEDEKRPKKEREALKAREAALLKAHEREWLGELVPYLLDREEDPDDPRPEVAYRWRRGFLAGLDAQCLTVGFAQAVAASPAARLLREMRIRGSASYHSLSRDGREPRVPTPPGIDRHFEYFELIGAPCLESLRVFRTGDEEDEPPEDGWCDCHCHLRGLEHVIAGMPRIEELHLLCNEYELGAVFALRNLTRLRVLRAYHVGERRRGGGDVEYEYPLGVLAANPALANLTHLQLHPHWAEARDGAGADRSFIPLDQVRALVASPHLMNLSHLQLRLSDMGDEGVREVVASGILKQLKWLDLRHGCITDAGARLFAECPDAKNLVRLDLSRNAVTAAGLAVLRKAKVNAVAKTPLTDAELESREYLREGDFE
jgi:uncharacterized protein (TIGR02996 family)